MKWISIFLWILFFQLNVHHKLIAQSNISDEFNIEYIDVTTGLSNNFVSKIIEDNLHIKWFATEGGINKYDGLSFTHYKPCYENKGLINENIETLFRDSKGNIWIGTKSGGLTKYNPVKDEFIDYNKFIDIIDLGVNMRVTSINEDENGNIWIGTWVHGLIVLNDETKKIYKHFHDYQHIRSIIKDRFGNLWFSSINVLNKYDPSEGRVVSFLLNAGTIFDLVEDELNNQIIIAARNGIYSCNSSNYTRKELKSSIKAGLLSISSLAIDAEHKLWAGSWKQGLFVSDSLFNNFTKIHLQDNKYS